MHLLHLDLRTRFKLFMEKCCVFESIFNSCDLVTLNLCHGVLQRINVIPLDLLPQLRGVSYLSVVVKQLDLGLQSLSRMVWKELKKILLLDNEKCT